MDKTVEGGGGGGFILGRHNISCITRENIFFRR